MAEEARSNGKIPVRIDVWSEDNLYVCEWDGVRYAGTNVFQLDSSLYYAGVPQPRNLYYVGDDDD